MPCGSPTRSRWPTSARRSPPRRGSTHAWSAGRATASTSTVPGPACSSGSSASRWSAPSPVRPHDLAAESPRHDPGRIQMSAPTVISNVRVFDGEQRGDPGTVVISDGLISAGPAPAGATAVDGDGGTLLPGLIDAHVHVDSVAQLEAAAAWGITTMLDMGNRDPASQAKLTSRPGLPALLRACGPANAPGSVFVTKMGFSASTTVS